MRIAYFDCFAGISGDMTVGAFLNAGMPLDVLRAAIDGLHLGATLTERTVMRSQIAATKFDVIVPEESGHAHDHAPGEKHSHEHPHDHAHDHDHPHDHEHDPGHDHPHEHAHEHSHPHGRSYGDIVQLISGSALSQRVQELALAIFHTIGVAESKLHNVPLDTIHFHEVGGVDSIVDIVGTAVALEFFKIDRVFSSVVRLGNGGKLHTQHGPMPTPAPATLEILRDYPVTLTDVPFELTTPTGAGIIKSLSHGVLRQEELSPVAIGYGAGSREIDGLANMLRVVIGEMDRAGHDEPVMLETNIDNLDPEIYPYVIEQLLDAGAHDAFLIPIIMKKGRPGVVLSALVPRPLIDRALEIIYAETPTLGVRIVPVGRRTLVRTSATADTSLGTVRVKSVEYGGRVRRVPEFDDCRRIALAHGIPLRDVRHTLLVELNPPSQP